jgi:hypothetical protein
VLGVLKNLAKFLLHSLPLIEPVEFSDGLLAFRCDRRLPFAPMTVASLTSSGSVKTRLEVCSYDVGLRLYRAQLVDGGETLQKLKLPARGAVRLAQAVRVSSRQIPKYFALTEDLSVGGVRLATAQMLPIGAALEMSLDLDDPSLPSIRVNGEVRWSAIKADGSYHSGVSFVGIDRGQHRILERYIESRLAKHRSVHGEG